MTSQTGRSLNHVLVFPESGSISGSIHSYVYLRLRIRTPTGTSDNSPRETVRHVEARHAPVSKFLHRIYIAPQYSCQCSFLVDSILNLPRPPAPLPLNIYFHRSKNLPGMPSIPLPHHASLLTSTRMTTLHSSLLHSPVPSIEWDDLLARVPPEWAEVLHSLINALENSFGTPGASETWESSFRSTHRRSMDTLDAAAETVIYEIKTLPEQQRPQAVAWWKRAWAAIVQFVVRMEQCVADAVCTAWEKVKAWFARVRRAIVRAWKGGVS